MRELSCWPRRAGIAQWFATLRMRELDGAAGMRGGDLLAVLVAAAPSARA